MVIQLCSLQKAQKVTLVFAEKIFNIQKKTMIPSSLHGKQFI